MPSQSVELWQELEEATEAPRSVNFKLLWSLLEEAMWTLIFSVRQREATAKPMPELPPIMRTDWPVMGGIFAVTLRDCRRRVLFELWYHPCVRLATLRHPLDFGKPRTVVYTVDHGCQKPCSLNWAWR